MGYAQRQIDTVIDQIHIAVLKPQTDIHLRVALEEIQASTGE